MEPALIPYSVNAQLWSDGAYKERYLALPGGDSTIEFNTSRGWNFPEKTVLVKSFALETEEGKPESRRWVETRFLTKQGTEWFGYSYEWNDEQTDGTLVETKGKDREFSIKTADGVRKQTWHYPSRAECMVCHSRAANFVLGLSELQMNKVHDYAGGVSDNQLRTLEHLGVLRVNYRGELTDRMRAEARATGMNDKEVEEYMARQTATRNQREAVSSSALLTFAPETYRHLVDPYDKKQDLTARAKSYLHANCSQCHVEAGGGNAQMELEFTTKLEDMRLVGVKPLHDAFDLADAKLIAPGHPEQSVLLHRMAQRKAGFMPPLATSKVDDDAVRLLDEWIKQLKATPPKAKD
jgi:mono/diheme cytochrome c family protein